MQGAGCRGRVVEMERSGQFQWRFRRLNLLGGMSANREADGKMVPEFSMFSWAGCGAGHAMGTSEMGPAWGR